MRYKVEVSNNFIKEAKRLIKKYPSLKSELSDLITTLETAPTKGVPLGRQIYKIRLAIASKGKGKSGGARILTLVRVSETSVIMFSIYDKGDKGTISDRTIMRLIQDL